MGDFFYSAAARDDLLEIWEYIARDNLEAADRVEREIENAILKLAKNPEMGHRRPDLSSRPIRFWSVHSYLIVYVPARPIEVARILHGYRDIAELLR